MFELYEVITNNHIFRLGMYAVLKTGGKQYKVQKDSKLLVEKIFNFFFFQESIL